MSEIGAAVTAGPSCPPRALVDTSHAGDGEDWRLAGAAWITPEGWLAGIHVTDGPSALLEALASPNSLAETYGPDRRPELGPGLYLSACPEVWTCRSSKRFGFLARLAPGERRRLADAILADRVFAEPGYLTRHEIEAARDDLRTFVETGEPSVVTHLAGQPFNRSFWTEDFLTPLGIHATGGPAHVLVTARGRFADCTSPWPGREELERLAADGLAGAFQRHGFSTVAQTVIWDKRAIVECRLLARGEAGA